MSLSLYEHQVEVLDKLKNGSILNGTVGSGKSITSLVYYFKKICGGDVDVNNLGSIGRMRTPTDLYIITTAKKRDNCEWEEDAAHLLLSPDKSLNPYDMNMVVDSWNNIKKYRDVKNAFFIFDEQRVVGYGVWTKSFLQIAKNNGWILLTATAGDTWIDYMPVFIANGFYKNKTEFIRRHVVYSPYTKFPKIQRYLDVATLEKNRKSIIVKMKDQRLTKPKHIRVTLPYDEELYKEVTKTKWDVFLNKPIEHKSRYFSILRQISNMDASRIEALIDIFKDKKRVIVFYSFNYERSMILEACEKHKINHSEWSGHNHQDIPETNSWLYLVQYTAGAEGWNCVSTDTTVFFSQQYSYKALTQAAGRINRMNTRFVNLYYYHFVSKSPIDQAIRRALTQKRNFNEREMHSRDLHALL